MINEIKVVAKANGINAVVTNSTEKIESQLNRLTRDEDLPIMLISWDIVTNISFDNNGMLKNPLSNITALLLSKPDDLTKAESEVTAEEMAELFKIFIQDLRAFLVPYQKTTEVPISACSYQLVPSKGMGKHSGVLAKWNMATAIKFDCK